MNHRHAQRYLAAAMRIACLFPLLMTSGCHVTDVPASLQGTQPGRMARITGLMRETVIGLDGVELGHTWNVYTTPGPHWVSVPSGKSYISAYISTRPAGMGGVRGAFAGDGWSEVITPAGIEIVTKAVPAVALPVYLKVGDDANLGEAALPSEQDARLALEKWERIHFAAPSMRIDSKARRVDGHWQWKLTVQLREAGGNVGYSVHGNAFAKGDKELWVPVGFREAEASDMTVPPGKRVSRDFICSGDELLGSVAHFTWVGRDAKGHNVFLTGSTRLLADSGMKRGRR